MKEINTLGPEQIRERESYVPVSFNIEQSTLKYLAGLALVDDSSTVGDQLRGAVTAYIAQRLSDPQLQTKIASRLDT